MQELDFEIDDASLEDMKCDLERVQTNGMKERKCCTTLVKFLELTITDLTTLGMQTMI